MKGQALLNQYKSKILKMPNSIKIGGFTFERYGSSGGSINDCIDRKSEMFSYYHALSVYPEVREKLGFRNIKVGFIWKKNVLKPTTVRIN